MNQSQRNNNFIVSLAGPNIDLTIVNIEEMNNYCEHWGKLATIVTEKKSYEKLEKLNYSLIGNYKKPKARTVVSNKKPYFAVYASLSENYMNGLLIAEDDTMSEVISELLCDGPGWKEHGVDIMVCRNGLGFITEREMGRADYLRISADPDFDPSILQKIFEVYQEKALAVMICQMFANDQYDTVKRYIDKKSGYYSEQGLSDYVDYYEMNKQLAYFVYFDVKNGKIINVGFETLMPFMKGLHKNGLLPMEDAELEILAKQITIK